MRVARTSTILARPCSELVMMPACEPVKDTASWPSEWIAIASNAIEIRSPAVSSMSSSRPGGSREIFLASPRRSSVVSPIALTTTTTALPCSRVDTTRRATRLMRSASPTEVPPNFWTMRLMDGTPPRSRMAPAWQVEQEAADERLADRNAVATVVADSFEPAQGDEREHPGRHPHEGCGIPEQTGEAGHEAEPDAGSQATRTEDHAGEHDEPGRHHGLGNDRERDPRRGGEAAAAERAQKWSERMAGDGGEADPRQGRWALTGRPRRQGGPEPLQHVDGRSDCAQGHGRFLRQDEVGVAGRFPTPHLADEVRVPGQPGNQVGRRERSGDKCPKCPGCRSHRSDSPVGHASISYGADVPPI